MRPIDKINVRSWLIRIRRVIVEDTSYTGILDLPKIREYLFDLTDDGPLETFEVNIVAENKVRVGLVFRCTPEPVYFNLNWGTVSDTPYGRVSMEGINWIEEGF